MFQAESILAAAPSLLASPSSTPYAAGRAGLRPAVRTVEAVTCLDHTDDLYAFQALILLACSVPGTCALHTLLHMQHIWSQHPCLGFACAIVKEGNQVAAFALSYSMCVRHVCYCCCFHASNMPCSVGLDCASCGATVPARLHRPHRFLYARFSLVVRASLALLSSTLRARACRRRRQRRTAVRSSASDATAGCGCRGAWFGAPADLLAPPPLSAPTPPPRSPPFPIFALGPRPPIPSARNRGHLRSASSQGLACGSNIATPQRRCRRPQAECLARLTVGRACPGCSSRSSNRVHRQYGGQGATE
eukprot:365464-Chlamydomonas_euryale.AAC.5